MDHNEWNERVRKWEAQGAPLDVDSVVEAIQEDMKNRGPTAEVDDGRVRNMTVKELREFAERKDMPFSQMMKGAEDMGLDLDGQ